MSTNLHIEHKPKFTVGVGDAGDAIRPHIALSFVGKACHKAGCGVTIERAAWEWIDPPETGEEGDPPWARLLRVYPCGHMVSKAS